MNASQTISDYAFQGDNLAVAARTSPMRRSKSPNSAANGASSSSTAGGLGSLQVRAAYSARAALNDRINAERRADRRLVTTTNGGVAVMSDALAGASSSLRAPSEVTSGVGSSFHAFGDNAATRKHAGQLMLDVHAAAQLSRRQLARALHVLPLAQATERECHSAYEVAQRALEANPMLDKQGVPGRYMAHQMKDGNREELRHALRQLGVTATKGARVMFRHAEALEGCIEALEENLHELAAFGVPIEVPRRPAEHGWLSPGTLAPSLEALGSGPSGSRPGSPLPGSPVMGPSTEGLEAKMKLALADSTDAKSDMARSIWLYDSSVRDDARAAIVNAVASAGQLATGCHSLCLSTRDQVRFVRAGLVSYRDKVHMAQRRVAAIRVRPSDHLGVLRPRSRSPPGRQAASSSPPFSNGALLPTKTREKDQARGPGSPIDLGQDAGVGGSSPSWRGPVHYHTRMRKREQHGTVTV